MFWPSNVWLQAVIVLAKQRSMRGANVRALRARLQRWQGQTPDPTGGSEYYDEPLQSLVREFQNQSGLKVDGVGRVEPAAADGEDDG